MIDHEYVVRLAGALWLGSQRLESKLDEHAARLGRGRRRRRRLDRLETVASLRRARRRMLSAIARARRELEEAQRGEFSPEEIARTVTRCTEQLLDVAAAVRLQDVPGELAPARELTARLADRPLRELDAFVELAVAVHDRDVAPLGRLSGRLALDSTLVAQLDLALQS